MKERLLTDIITALFIILFIYTGFSKYLDFEIFVADIRRQPIPDWLRDITIWTLPGFEILLGILLIFDRTRKPALIASFLLMGIFTLYTAAALLKLFDRIPCGCGGMIRSLSWRQHFVFNLVFALLALAGILLSRRKQCQSKIQQS